MLKLLFLNPPSLDGRLVNRHIMDPHVSKGSYLYPPYDLLLLSGWFHPHEDFELQILDAMALGISETSTLEKIQTFEPDFILALTAPQSFTLDMKFLERVKKASKAVLFSAGAVEHARRRAVLDKHNFLDGILLEPLAKDFYDYLTGDKGPFKTLVLRDQVELPLERYREKWFDLPVNRHDLIDARLYSYPAMTTDRFTSVLTSYGCPFSCTYCEAPGFKFTKRKVESVIEELELVKASGIQEICFKDWTFAADKKHAVQILDQMIERKLDLSWFTFSRADVLDRELIQKMKQAGCTTIQMGVETVNSVILTDFKRKNNNELLREVFTICREEGLETMGTFIIGLPGDTQLDIEKTIDFVLELDPDFASFNIITPLLGSELRAEWEAKGFVDPNKFEVQDSTQAGLTHLEISSENLTELRDMAVRRFYFRPKYLIRRLRKLKNIHQFLNQARTGWQLFVDHALLRHR